ncbi:nuclear transport factor 2 family protein [Amycolatopsis sp. NPDC051371]|uniref:nuclear transport factor 2 family protein n=1 Tax=Amycolatopsis sp. NPDC051371 TaxID=3155800 RepID=UPI00341683D9
MADSSIVHHYLEAMCSANGARAAALFTEDGVLDDYRGGHRAGRDVIRKFIDARPPRTLDFLSDVIRRGPRLTVYTHMNYEDGRSKTVRFIFTAPGDLIEHLCNSEIEFVPPELRITPLDPAAAT